MAVNNASSTMNNVENAERQEDSGGLQRHISKVAIEVYTISYLILFALLGTLARLGLEAITDYTGAPVTFSSVWPNFAGCIIMGFLVEDRKLFLYEWGVPIYENAIQAVRRVYNNVGDVSLNDQNDGRLNEFDNQGMIDLDVAKRAHLAVKKTIPLYIGLTTGFCGSFTSFSAFIRDMFLTLSNSMPEHTTSYSGGYSFMAVASVLIVSVCLSLSGLFLGAHLANMLESVTPSLSYFLTRILLNRLAVPFAWGCWLGAVLLTIFLPDHNNANSRRGQATFSLVFAPLGCLCRFYTSVYLNDRIASFPLGTFLVNVFGTAILGISWDLAHVPLGGIIGCQVSQGINDGFCGCLTTVSTWVSELANLNRHHAYIYGSMSIIVALSFCVIIMGSMRWTTDFAALQCVN